VTHRDRYKSAAAEAFIAIAKDVSELSSVSAASTSRRPAR
jgi:hypothetical protein